MAFELSELPWLIEALGKALEAGRAAPVGVAGTFIAIAPPPAAPLAPEVSA